MDAAAAKVRAADFGGCALACVAIVGALRLWAAAPEREAIVSGSGDGSRFEPR
jgi:hypothetical protein